MAEENEELFIALYTDADVHGKLAAMIRKHGYNARSASEEGNGKLSDQEQPEFAAAQGRALLTHNQKDFLPLHRRWQRQGKHHSGIIVSPQLALGELLRRMLQLLNRVAADEIRDDVKYLSDFAERKKDAKPARRE